MSIDRALLCLITAALALSAAGGSRAASLNVLTDSRSVAALGAVPGSQAPTDPVFDASLGSCCAHVEQHSSLLATGFFGTGSFFTDGGGGDAHSVFEVSFDVAEVTPYQLTGHVTGGVHSGYLLDSSTNQPLDGDFSASGVFLPGTSYVLHLSVENTPTGFSAGDWQLTLTVPEPALAWLALAGAAALTLRARRSVSLTRAAR